MGPDVAQGLLTGNVERGARIKLEHYGVWHYFEFGAFGDDSALRNDLGPHALRRAKEKHAADFDPANTFIIGDTLLRGMPAEGLEPVVAAAREGNG